MLFLKPSLKFSLIPFRGWLYIMGFSVLASAAEKSICPRVFYGFSSFLDCAILVPKVKVS